MAPVSHEIEKRRRQALLLFLDFELEKPKAVQLWLLQPTWDERLW